MSTDHRYELTWDKKGNRWRKKYKGHRFSFGAGDLGKIRSYKKAQDAFRLWKQQADQAEAESQKGDWERVVDALKSYQACIAGEGDTPRTRAQWEYLELRIRHAQNAILTKKACPAQPSELIDHAYDIDQCARLNALTATLAEYSADFLKYLRQSKSPLAAALTGILLSGGDGEADVPQLTQKLEQLLVRKKVLPSSAVDATGIDRGTPSMLRDSLAPEIWSDGIDQRARELLGPAPWEFATPANGDKTVGGTVDLFMKYQEAKVAQSKLSTGRCENIRAAVEQFRKYIGSGTDVCKITTQIIASYRDSLVSGPGSPYTKRDRISVLKSYIHWLYHRELIEQLPRILESRELSRDLNVTVTPGKIVTFEVEEVKRLLAESDDRGKLYWLLMLNCGMGQQDIADLRHDEVDWKAGRIRRKRSKTKASENVPEVDYLLWRETFRLLEHYRSSDPDLVLVNEGGRPLKTEEIVDGKYKKNDNIKSLFFRLARKVGIKDKPLKLLRKTGATWLEQHEMFFRYKQLYLGHSPRSVADKYYVDPKGGGFDKAIQWLGKQFDIN